MPPYVPVTYTATLPDGSTDSGTATFGGAPTGTTPFTEQTIQNMPSYAAGFGETFVSGFHPTSKDQCKNGGYQNWTDDQGQPFKNPGQCIKYVNEHSGGTTD